MTVAEKHKKIAEQELNTYRTGYEKGFDSGHKEGHTDGYEEGYEIGHGIGYSAGYNDGKAKTYNEGFADGQQSMVDESKIIEASATGNDILRLDDVSEIPHDIELQVSGGNIDLNTVKVKVQGKNLANILENYDTSGGTPNALLVANRAGYYCSCIPVSPNTTYKLSKETANSNRMRCFYYDREPVVSETWSIGGSIYDIAKSLTITTPANAKYMVVAWGNVLENFQIEFGDTATEYEPYIEPVEYIVNTEGIIKDVRSISPNMTFIPNTDGVQLTANYHKSWGMQTEHDRFWDTILLNGEITDCSNLFYGPTWTDETFKPNRDIKPIRANYMFMDSRVKTTPYLNKVDFSNCAAVVQTFYRSSVEELGTLNFGAVVSGWNGLQQTLQSCTKLRKIGLLIPPRDKKAQVDTFSSLSALIEITFGGTIYMSISFAKSPLIKASIISVITHLADDVTGMTATFNKAAVDKAFETSEGANDGSTSAEWLAQVDTKPNWTIALA